MPTEIAVLAGVLWAFASASVKQESTDDDNPFPEYLYASTLDSDIEEIPPPTNKYSGNCAIPAGKPGLSHTPSLVLIPDLTSTLHISWEATSGSPASKITLVKNSAVLGCRTSLNRDLHVSLQLKFGIRKVC
ncbi:hypothetical protein B0H14DRAFT_2565430 [Mycena olivaceomarginata]|nr:hypothetical protein B0H14DRAFT_2565430 [Mycena olivaceomarginata]